MSAIPLQQDAVQPDVIDRLVAERRPGYGLARTFYHNPAIYERHGTRVLPPLALHRA